MLVKVRSFLLLPDVYPSTYLLQFFVLFIFSIFLFFFSFCTLGNVLMVPHFVLRIDSANNRGYKVCFYRLCLDLVIDDGFDGGIQQCSRPCLQGVPDEGSMSSLGQ